MLNLALDDNNNIYLVGGQLATVTNGDQVAQAVKCRLQTFKGTFFFNQDYGVPYLEILQDDSKIEAFNISIKRFVDTTDGVTKISTQSNFDREQRVYTMKISVTTEYSQDGDFVIQQGYNL